ncbi:hypothetical protein M758_4G022100 [Ceratodon purpureus]|nr:hypothetical protein M758_4G022100 [Ceratodon purpureus]
MSKSTVNVFLLCYCIAFDTTIELHPTRKMRMGHLINHEVSGKQSFLKANTKEDSRTALPEKQLRDARQNSPTRLDAHSKEGAQCFNSEMNLR